MANIDHIMPRPVIVPIFWGHDYATNSKTSNQLGQMLSDLVTGPFMNGLAQYGIHRGSMLPPIIIDDLNPPATLVYVDSSNQLKDEITKQLIAWIAAGTVPSPPSPDDINQFYIILPPPQTTPQTFHGTNDPVGNGIQGWHNEGKTDPAPPPTFYWAIVKTNDVGPASSTADFMNGVRLR